MQEAGPEVGRCEGTDLHEGGGASRTRFEARRETSTSAWVGLGVTPGEGVRPDTGWGGLSRAASSFPSPGRWCFSCTASLPPWPPFG